MNMHLLLYFLYLSLNKKHLRNFQPNFGTPFFFIGNFPKKLSPKNATNHLNHPQNPNPPVSKELFTLKLDTAYLRNERIMERKLRPWLERKIATWDAIFLLGGKGTIRKNKIPFGGQGGWWNTLVSFLPNLNMSPQVDFSGASRFFWGGRFAGFRARNCFET